MLIFSVRTPYAQPYRPTIVVSFLVPAWNQYVETQTTNEKRKSMPSFCSECGERLATQRVRFLLSPTRCHKCDPGVARGRVLLLGLLVLALSLGFVIGRYTRRPEPFYFIGTPVEPASLPFASSADKGNQERPPARADVQRAAGGSGESICGAPTRSGKPCQRKVRGGGFCWQHRGKR
jgi:hypothetical protein